MPAVEWTLRLLAAEAMVAGGLWVSYSVARRLVPGVSPALRWTATCAAGMASATAGFHLLRVTGTFRLPAALALVGLAVAAVVFLLRENAETWRDLRGDARAVLAGLGFDPRRRLRSTSTLVALAFFLLLAVRALLVPVVAWDTLTYHGTKAALWVQSGGNPDLVAPGGWSIYRTYVGGGEIFHAWAMLLLRSDLLVGLVDVVQWVFLGVTIVALGQVLGLSPRSTAVAAFYVLFLPAVARPLGALYVDTTLAVSLLVAVALGVHAVRATAVGAAVLAWTSLGVAVGIKIFAAPVAALLAPAIGILLWWQRRSWTVVAWCAVGALLAAMVAVPFLAHNVALTGYPLSPLPIEVAGITLGQSNDAFVWFMQRPQLADVTLAGELDALLTMCGAPGMVPRPEPTLGLLTLVGFPLAVAGLIRLARREWRAPLLVALFITPLLLSFYGSGAKALRIVWAETSGRYVLPVGCAVALLGFAAWRRDGRASRIWEGVLLVGVIVHLFYFDLFGWTSTERWTAGVAVVVLLVAGAIATRWGARLAPLAVGPTLVALSLIAAVLLSEYRASTREQALRTSIVLHSVPRYWVDPALAVDDPARPRRIAVTAGPWQNSDNWFLYPFLGRRYQNELVYVPVTRDGAIVDLARQRERVARSGFAEWYTRLVDQSVTEVMSFEPAGLEMFWMERRPDLFERLDGERGRWALYRFLPADAGVFGPGTRR